MFHYFFYVYLYYRDTLIYLFKTRRSRWKLTLNFELITDFIIFVLVHFSCIVIKDWRKYVIVILIHCNFIYRDVYCEHINYVSCLIRGILHVLVIVNKRMRNYQKLWSFYILNNFQQICVNGCITKFHVKAKL